MRKIVIEQGGNAVMFLLFTLTALDFMQRSVVGATRVMFEFGWPSFAFVGWMIGFGLIRYREHRRDPHFRLTSGEASAADERERLISFRTAQRTLQVVVTLAILLLAVTAVFGIDPRVQAMDFRVIMIAAFGALLMVYCVTFIAFWFYYDRRL
ncbi:DUF2178 domain-containing protein [Lacticaseibacillus daqingensis]|uniref:DUF2178 domain-containing protein n=1 Tax=Lacticaseibacillus daqingensis TaxID=2486014 RepID=UPI0013DE1B86|nr:DUF2178 domain-containing protein [Lacticaseibacillus daqingensis]